MAKRVAIINYGAGNLRSVYNAFRYLGVEVEIVSDPNYLTSFSHLVLPGVGSFHRAMLSIKNCKLDQALPKLIDHGIPLLGICLGMQILASRGSEGGESLGLGLIAGDVDRFSINPDSIDHKIPHVGFNTVQTRSNSRLFAGLQSGVDFYFTHSFRLHCQSDADVAASSFYGEHFVSALEQGLIAGTQFHPEKSQANGLRLLSNFLQYF